MGNGELVLSEVEVWGLGGIIEEVTPLSFFNAQCPMPNAQCNDLSPMCKSKYKVYVTLSEE
ncbi:MAG: hypothetical protein KME40_16235 [Komarekiella atlantica HA4396-MV6]|jgi:hypothetical protein|nr:hypothetical protein [Komarekiella atlantica HA4396-MV6]